MIKRKDLLALSFYERSPFTGSDKQMNYRVEKVTDPDQGKKLLQATVWPGPLCFPLAEETSKKTKTADFSDNGLEQLVQWMNEESARFSRLP